MGSHLFQVTHGERLLVGGEHLVELSPESLRRRVRRLLQRGEVALARLAVALEHVRRGQLRPSLMARDLKNPFLTPIHSLCLLWDDIKISAWMEESRHATVFSIPVCSALRNCLRPPRPWR